MHSEPLAACDHGDCELVARGILRPYASGRTPLTASGLTPYPWPDELIRLGRDYRQATARSVVQRFPSQRSQLMQCQAADERALLRRAFIHVDADREMRDELFERLLLQYLRVKTAVFALLVHQPGEHGLRKFLNHFTQIKVYAPEAETLAPTQPIEPGLNVHATEYRLAPDAWLKMRRPPRADIEETVAEAGPRRESAWIIHFKRADPRKTLPLYGRDVRRLEGEADQIIRSLSARPAELQFLRGLDICGVENAQPLWVSAPTLRRVRRKSWRLTTSAHMRVEPLRLSIHAGEDFRWLTSGTRAVAEPFQWHLIERGDRIGHGIAITIDPQGWWERWTGRVIEVTRIDRLLDLTFLAEYAHRRTDQENEWLRVSIQKVISDLRLRQPENAAVDLIPIATRFSRCLGSPLTRRLMSSSVPIYESAQLHESWLFAYLWNRSTQERASEILHLKVGDDDFDDLTRCRRGSRRIERDLLIKARKTLIRELARWQVCIESNPTSNLVVGSLDAMAAQDFLQRRPTEVCEEGDETLTWTISTDDPITFSTTLADEYAYAWAGMVLREKNPYDPAYARALLDEAAATSMRMRFTMPTDQHGSEPHSRGRTRDRN
jgi:hypothetical protein